MNNHIEQELAKQSKDRSEIFASNNDEIAVCAEKKQALYEELCKKLDGVIPDELFDKLKHSTPRDTAIAIMLELGGRIALNYSYVDIAHPYECPEEVNGLNDTIDGYTFTIAGSPFLTLAAGLSAGQDVDNEVIQAYDLKNYLPMIISKDGKVQLICMVDHESHCFEIPLGCNFELNIDITGTPEEITTAQEEGLEKISRYLDQIKKTISNDLDLLDEQEALAIDKWAEKHSYEIRHAYRANIDVFT